MAVAAATVSCLVRRSRRSMMRLLPASQPISTMGPAAAAAAGLIRLNATFPTPATGAAPLGWTVEVYTLASTAVAVTASVRSGRLAPRPWVTHVYVSPCWAAAATANVRPSDDLIIAQSSSWQAPPAAAAGGTLTCFGASGGAARSALADWEVHAAMVRPSKRHSRSTTNRRKPTLQRPERRPERRLTVNRDERERNTQMAAAMCFAISSELVAAGDGALSTCAWRPSVTIKKSSTRSPRGVMA